MLDLTQLKTPGVYIDEVPKFPPSIAAVETAIPAFIGYTQKAEENGTALPAISVTVGGGSHAVSEPRRISSLLDYETLYGKGPNESITVLIKDTLSGTTVVNRTISASVGSPSVHTLYYHMQMYFANGGGPCYIVSVGATTAVSVEKNKLLAGLEVAKKYDEPTLLVFPQAKSLTADDMYEVYSLALAQCAELQDRFVIMDCHNDSAATLRSSGTLGTANLKYGAAYHPYLKTSVGYLYADSTITIDHDTDPDGDGIFDGVGDMNGDAFNTLSSEVQNKIKAEINNNLFVTLPPCATMAGIYAAVDAERGVWKAPANVSLRKVKNLTLSVTHKEQETLNVDVTAGKSINVIRPFTGKGILVWGARTLAGNDNEWRYVNVRRFFNMVEESTKKATEQFVFEPNDANTWVKVQAMIENFLTTLWRQGALQGATTEKAFYVVVGLGKTMTALDILEGRMIVEIGLAVVRPAEFIVLRFSHKLPEA